jgi:hypothetical protein
MITVSQLDSFEPAEFSAVGRTWDQVTEGLDATNRLVGGMAGELNSWQGDAAQSAKAAIDVLVANVVPAVVMLSSVGWDISGFTHAVGEAKRQLHTARSAALSAGCTVADDGTVTPPAAPTPPPSLVDGPPDPSAPPPSPTQQAQQQVLSKEYSSACSVWDDLVTKAGRWEQAIKSALSDATSADAQTAHGLASYITSAGGFGRAVSGGRTGTKRDQRVWFKFADFVDSGGHVNDFAGGAATAVIKSFEGAVDRAGKAAGDWLTKDVIGPDDLWKSLEGDDPALALINRNATRALSLFDLAENPIVKNLTKGLPEECRFLSKVPYIGYAFTAFDLADSFIDGKGLGAHLAPVYDLATATAGVEGFTSLVASQSLDFIPGVGEVVIAGTVVVGVVYGTDKLGKFLWDDKDKIVHGIGHAASSAWSDWWGGLYQALTL